VILYTSSTYIDVSINKTISKIAIALQMTGLVKFELTPELPTLFIREPFHELEFQGGYCSGTIQDSNCSTLEELRINKLKCAVPHAIEEERIPV
jgi:hypothetical protein